MTRGTGLIVINTDGVLGWIQYHQTTSATFHSPKHHTPSVYRTALISVSVGSGRLYQCSKTKQFLPDGSINWSMHIV